MTALKKHLFSDRGMYFVNILFLLAVFIRNRGIIFAACLAWIAHLVFAIKTTSSGASRVVYSAFMIFAAAVIAANGYFMLRCI